MKKAVFLIPFFLYAGILSDLKEKEFNFDTQKSVKNSQITKNSWINPIMLQYSVLRDNKNITTKTFAISINQPIFKSGAIYYSIKYANLSKKYNLKQIELQKRGLIKQALDLAYEYKINDLNEKILKLKIENAKITVKRKKDAFLSGTGDSSDLDNAILNLNSLKLSLYDIKIAKNDLMYEFKKISDLNINEVKLPKFKILSQKSFLNQNIEFQNQKMYKKIALYLYKMQKGNQFLTVSFEGNYNLQKIEKTTHFYNYGLSFSIPIDVNAKDRIESAKIDYLKSSLLEMDKKRELLSKFNKNIKDISLMKKKLQIYNKNIEIYENLINSTLESIKAGSATEDDLKILQNSKEVLIINKKILKLKIQEKLLELYYTLSSFTN